MKWSQLIIFTSMNSVFRKRTLHQVIASRHVFRRLQDEQRTMKQTSNKNAESHQKNNLDKDGSQFRMDQFLRKTIFNSQDKYSLLRYLEKKYRIYFAQVFAPNQLTWIFARDKKIIQRHYDSSKKSFYLLRGTLVVSHRVHEAFILRSSNSSEEHSKKYQQVTRLENQGGFGMLFHQQLYQKMLLSCQNAVILQIDHSNEELELIQRQCLMTTQERQNFISCFPLFKNLESINKYYTPFFIAKNYMKGDYIYQIGEQSEFLYLIVEGQVQFQSRILGAITGDETAIDSLLLKNNKDNFTIVSTEVLGKMNFFGQQQILGQKLRQQGAKCASLSCLLMQIPIAKLDKLLFYNQFRENLTNSWKQKTAERQKKIQNFMLYRYSTKDPYKSQKRLSTMQFQDFNEAVFQTRSDQKDSKKKLSLKDTRTKILHGSALKTNQGSAKIQPEVFSMLQVNQQMYQKCMKKFKSFSLQQKKRKQTAQDVLKPQKGKQGRSLRQMWQILKLQNIIQQDEKLGVENSDGRAYFNTHMRIAKHLKDVKSYRPKTISSNCRVKTEYLQYLQTVI